MTKSIVVAYDMERTIGRDGTLPWAGQLPSDMRHFKHLTENKTVIMGRKTYESLPEAYRPLPHRQNIVISLSRTALEGAQIADCLGDAYSQADYEPMVIGGAQIYKLALPTVDHVYATEIFTHTPNGDAFFPPLLHNEWQVEDRDYRPADKDNRFSHSFVTYFRRSPIE